MCQKPTGKSRVGNIIDLVIGDPFSVSGLGPGVCASGKGEKGDEGRYLHIGDQEGVERWEAIGIRMMFRWSLEALSRYL
jgi:hypothetical protein